MSGITKDGSKRMSLMERAVMDVIPKPLISYKLAWWTGVVEGVRRCGFLVFEQTPKDSLEYKDAVNYLCNRISGQASSRAFLPAEAGSGTGFLSVTDVDSIGDLMYISKFCNAVHTDTESFMEHFRVVKLNTESFSLYKSPFEGVTKITEDFSADSVDAQTRVIQFFQFVIAQRFVSRIWTFVDDDDDDDDEDFEWTWMKICTQ